MLICRMHQMIWLPIYGEKGGRKREKRYGIVVRAIPANITNSFYRLFNENFAGNEERYKSSRFLGGLLLSVLWFGFKFLFTLLLIVMAIGEWSLVGWKMRRFPIAGSEELAYWAEWLYVVMMAVILLYLIVWTVAGLSRKSYLVLAVCAALFLSFAYSSHMETVRAQIICSSHRYVWDADLQKCREGCFVWMEEDECLSDEKQ